MATLRSDISSIRSDMVTKADLLIEIGRLANTISETIATPMERHFAEVKDSMNVRAEVEALKRDMLKIKDVLHLA